jgi:hypothetical protein
MEGVSSGNSELVFREILIRCPASRRIQQKLDRLEQAVVTSAQAADISVEMTGCGIHTSKIRSRD